MSFVSANDHPTPVGPEDPLYYAPRSVRCKADPRPNAPQQTRLDDLSRTSASHFDKMHEEATARFTSPLVSEFIYRRRSRALLATMGGIGVAIAVTAVGALVFYTVFPRSESDPSQLTASISTAASATPAQVKSENSQALLQGFMSFHTDNPEHANSEIGPPGPAKEGSQKPQALLEKFIQWRQKK